MSNTRVTVAGVIFNTEGRILLCERSQTKKFAPGAWHMPGGGLDENETPEVALKRELNEELALELKGMPIDTGVTHTYPDPDRTDFVLFYTAYALNTPTLRNDENSAFVFVSEDEFPKYLAMHRNPEEVADILSTNLRAAAAARKILT